MKRFAIIVAAASLSSCVGADFTLPCIYTSSEPDGELQECPNCALRRGGALVLAPEHLQRMHRPEHGLASALIDGSWHYIKPNGENVAVLTYDNGPDYFVNGLARALVNGKIAYYDTDLRQVLSPKYDWAWPFHDGRALVCAGCQLGSPDDDGHTPVIGGVWGYIDRSGNEIVPVKYARDAVPKL
jgi:hypothetical protein